MWILAALLLAGCGEVARLPVSAGTGPHPTLPAPKSTLIPTVHIAPALGWPAGATPQGPAGTQVQAFARDLAHPRWLLVLPNGDVLVAETNAPARDDPAAGLVTRLRAWVTGLVMRRAGAAVPSPNRITLLRDSRAQGVADQRHVLLEGSAAGLNSPFGMVWIDGMLYVANTDAVLRFPYALGANAITAPGVKLVDLPAGVINHHWTKNLLASPNRQQLYITVGSNSNVAERGMEAEAGRAAIWQFDLASGAMRPFATGLRNPNGMAWVPGSDTLWTVVNERDELGSDLVPDYLSSVQDGAFYGWPYSWYGHHVDARVQPPRPDLVARAKVPDYALGPHTASLGLAWSPGGTLPGVGAGMLVGQHGSWNRRPHSGYKVILVPFVQGRPAGEPQDVLTGFLDVQGNALGRPVGVALDTRGGLLVADDVGNIVWRVSARL
jgi:glucose/arabinose dehydrogenase